MIDHDRTGKILSIHHISKDVVKCGEFKNVRCNWGRCSDHGGVRVLEPPKLTAYIYGYCVFYLCPKIL